MSLPQGAAPRYANRVERAVSNTVKCGFESHSGHPVRARLADGEHWYEYPRYLFTNESADILRLCGETLDRLGVAWRFSRRNSISVARREAVARLDEFVGPKC